MPVPPKDTPKIQWLLRKICVMLVSIISPEILVAEAFGERNSAYGRLAELHQLGLTNWTVVHGFFADMGGFAVIFENGTRYTLNQVILIWLLRQNYLHPDAITIRKEDIKDRSRADGFTKAVACLQAIWLVAQCIARAAQHLPVSPLEIATCAYVACAVMTYLLWWNKPLSVEEQYVVGPVLRLCILKDLRERFPFARGWTSFAQNYEIAGGLRERSLSRQTEASSDPVDFSHFGKRSQFILWVGGLVFCSIHCIAWNFGFASPAEAYHWRIFAASGTASAAFLVFLYIPFYASRYMKVSWLGWKGDGIPMSNWETSLTLVMTLVILLFIASRIYLLVAMFYSLHSMPAGVYATVDWTRYVPHWM